MLWFSLKIDFLLLGCLSRYQIYFFLFISTQFWFENDKVVSKFYYLNWIKDTKNLNVWVI